MAKDKKNLDASLIGEMFRVGVYKRSQGRITRQVTFAAIGITVALGAWKLYSPTLLDAPMLVRFTAPAVVLFLGIWIAFRLVNWATFANFLIAVEAEMNKVSWPSRAELMRSSLVVMIVIFALAGLLFGFDLVWTFAFKTIGVLH